MKISEFLTDDAILTELGGRLARRRLDLHLTQADLAEQAGVAKRTVERIEAGASAQMSTIIRLLRVLGLLPGLDRAIPDAVPRPLDLLHGKAKRRQRASAHSRIAKGTEPWSWDEDT